MNILNRLINLVKNEIQHNFSPKEKPFTHQEDFEDFSFNEKSAAGTSEKNFSKQLKEDLELFELVPPIDLQELKKQRNAIYKKYHPDLFHNDLAKKTTAKEIIQLYNDAYERIMKAHHHKY